MASSRVAAYTEVGRNAAKLTLITTHPGLAPKAHFAVAASQLDVRLIGLPMTTLSWPTTEA